jgi:uncharacterized protein YydD (DUF2326 family)
MQLCNGQYHLRHEHILYNCISSDHRPISFVVNCPRCVAMPISRNKNDTDSSFVFHDWAEIAIDDVNSYSVVLADQLWFAWFFLVLCEVVAIKGVMIWLM